MCAAIECSGDAQGLHEWAVGRLRGLEIVVGNVFDQAEPKKRRRDPENYIVFGQRGGKIGLCDIATGRVGSSAYDEQFMSPAVRRPVRISDKACLTDRAGRNDE